jgi:hypothetical protein
MRDAFASFARTGDPGWAPYGEERLTKTFGDDGAVVPDPLREARERCAPVLETT